MGFDIIGPDEFRSSHPKGEAHKMKKLMTLMLGMMFVLGTTAVFAQDTPKKEDSKTEKKAGKKKGGKKKTDETKKDAGK